MKKDLLLPYTTQHLIRFIVGIGYLNPVCGSITEKNLILASIAVFSFTPITKYDYSRRTPLVSIGTSKNVRFGVTSVYFFVTMKACLLYWQGISPLVLISMDLGFYVSS